MKGDNKMSKDEISWTYMQDENCYVIFKPDGDVCGPNSLCDYLNRLERENTEPSFKDKLMQGYEKIGMTSAFHKYGKHSTFGYKHQDHE